MVATATMSTLSSGPGSVSEARNRLGPRAPLTRSRSAGSFRLTRSAGSFQEVYGDDGEIGVTSRGKTFAAWGEGFSWLGPGGTWFDLQS